MLNDEFVNARAVECPLRLDQARVIYWNYVNFALIVPSTLLYIDLWRELDEVEFSCVWKQKFTLTALSGMQHIFSFILYAKIQCFLFHSCEFAFYVCAYIINVLFLCKRAWLEVVAVFLVVCFFKVIIIRRHSIRSCVCIAKQLSMCISRLIIYHFLHTK